MANKTTSAAVIITDGELLLMGHITGNLGWDLPKGQVDPGESFLQAAVRELGEETGIQVQPTQLIPLGTHTYTNTKNLVLYVWPRTTAQMPDPSQLVCTSMFVDQQGEMVPELDKFEIVRWDQLSQWARPPLLRVLTQVENQIKQVVVANV